MAEVEFITEGHVAVITINRPEARNSVNQAVAEGLEDSIDKIENDDSVWIGIITGVPPVFCAGADLKEIGAGRFAALVTERGGFAGITERQRTKPLIAAVDGPALAGGTEIVLSCDLVVASASAKFGIPEVKRALIAGAGGLFRLPRVLPFNVALECAMTGDPITAERAHHFGMVNVLCEAGEALNKAKELAQRIEANGPLAVRNSRQIVYTAAAGDETEAWELTKRGFAEAMASEDMKEGVAAFIEKRPPNWTGR